jgi:hypothetical protein
MGFYPVIACFWDKGFSALIAANKMQVQMKDYLAAPALHIEQKIVAAVVDAVLSGHVFTHKNHVGHKRAVILLKLVYAADVLSGHHKKMHRSLGAYVFEDNDQIILVNNVGRGLFV